jgi:hypothetical protein
VSRACAERALLPRLRDASPGAVILADGFSCRTQIRELDSGGREAMHLAELLATMGNLPYVRPEEKAAPRMAEPSAGAKAAALALTGVGVAGVASAVGAAGAAALRKTIRRR